MEGNAVIDCTLAATGALRDCVVVAESPANVWFGVASLRMAQAGWLTAEPAEVDGLKVDGERVRITVPFLSGRKDGRKVKAED